MAVIMRRAKPTGVLWTRTVALAGVLAGVLASQVWAAGTALAQKGSHAGAAVACEIVAEVEPARVTVRGRITAAAPVKGTYELDATRPGPGGSTAVRSKQTNTFEARPGEPLTIGQIAYGGSGRTVATLRVTTGGETVTCRREIDVP